MQHSQNLIKLIIKLIQTADIRITDPAVIHIILSLSLLLSVLVLLLFLLYLFSYNLYTPTVQQ